MRDAHGRITPDGPPETARDDFRLLRYFAVASLIAIVLAALGLGLYFRHTALRQLMKAGEDNNVAIAQALASALRSYYEPLIEGAGSSPADRARSTGALHQVVLDSVRETRVVTLRLYDSNGRALYSSGSRPADGDGSAGAGFATARSGTVSTRLDRPDPFDAFGLLTPHGGVLTSHVPVRRARTSDVEAVLEISSDVTPFYEQIRRTQMQLRFGAAAMVILLYGALYLVVRRADKIIRTQDDQRRRDADTIRYRAPRRADRSSQSQAVR